jgi:hypothetical protein
VSEVEGEATGGDGRGDALVDGEDLGSLMMQQLTDVLGSWTTVLGRLAQHGVDPTPMLKTLADTLRATADQLDPPGSTPP